MTLKIKICGLKTPEAIHAAIDNGAHYIGFIFFAKSPRHLTIERAKALRPLIKSPTKLVAVVVDADNAMLDEIVENVRPDMLQLHGHETRERVVEIIERYHLPIIKAFSIESEQDFAQIAQFKPLVEEFLFDAKAPKNALLPGGNGISFDWSLLNKLDDTQHYMLSGGLNANNIAAALEIAHPLSIDISSGVETAPGIKDVDLIIQFFDIVKTTLNQGDWRE